MLDKIILKEVPSWRETRTTRSHLLVALGLGVCLLSVSGLAQSQSFDFTFSGGGGTVTGQIQGLLANGNNQVGTVSVDSATGLSISTPISFASNVIVDSFSVAGGNITGVTFDGYNLHTVYNLELNFNGANLLESLTKTYAQNINGFTGVTFTTAAPVPELPIPLMLSLGMLMPALARRAYKARQRFA